MRNILKGLDLYKAKRNKMTRKPPSPSAKNQKKRKFRVWRYRRIGPNPKSLTNY